MSDLDLSKPRKGDGRRARKKRKRQRDAAERRQKQLCRDRDGGCRFPLCGCRRYGVPEVSHSKHKGMGGNPAGDRSVSALMICLCGWRHRESRVSLHAETLRWEPLTDEGADGLVRWLIRRPELADRVWVELAVEVEIGKWAPFDGWQAEFISHLSRMDQ